MGKIYITSDWHFGHKNMVGPNGIVAQRRHFQTTEEMNEAIIAGVNSVVHKDDVIYFLGDATLGLKPREVLPLLERINGHIIMFRGNHDTSKMFKYIANNGTKGKFELVDVGITVKANGKRYYLSHFPIGLGDKRKNLRSICGHIHEESASAPNVINLCIDSPELPIGTEFAQPILLSIAMELVDQKWEKWAENELIELKYQS